MTKNNFALHLAVALFTVLNVYAEKLVINSNQSNPTEIALCTKVIDDLKKQNPDLEVVFNTTDHKDYKTAIRNWLTTEPPDIVFWFSGNRLKAFVDPGLFDDVSDLWQRTTGIKTSARPLSNDPWMESNGAFPLFAPLGNLLSQGHFREARYRRSEDLGRVRCRGEKAEGKPGQGQCLLSQSAGRTRCPQESTWRRAEEQQPRIPLCPP